MYKEVLDSKLASFAHHPLGAAKQRVRLVGGAHSALLITDGRPRLLQAFALEGTHLQFLTEVLIHALYTLTGSTTTAAAAVTASEHAPAMCRAHGEGS